MNFLNKAARILVVMAIALCALVPSMASAQSFYRPDFTAGKQIYIDPLVANHPNFPVSLSGLESKLNDAGAKHGIKYIVVVVQQTSETGGGNLAAVKLDELLLRWNGASGFPSDRYLVTLWMRSASNPSEGWVAVNAGADLKAYGLGKAELDAANGPVNTNIRKYMPQDPRGFFAGVAGSVNQVIDDYNAEQERQRSNAEFMGKLPTYILGFLVVGGIGVFFFFRSKATAGLRTQAAELLNEWTEKMDSANALYLKLRTGYLGFIKDQSDWQGKFSGATKAQYEGALSSFADFSARRAKADAHLADARKLFEKGDYKSVLSKLQNETITVTGGDISLEDATLFGGLVKKSDYKPSELLNSMEALFDNTNQALAGIMKALNEALAAGTELDAVQADLEMTWARIGDAKFAPHKAEFDSINRDEEQVRLTFKSDPVPARQAMVALLNRARTIQAALAAAKT